MIGRGDNALKNDAVRAAAPALILFSITINVLALALPVYTLQIYDRIIPNKATETLIVLSFGVLAALMIETMLRLIRAHMITHIGADFERNASARAVAHTVFSDLSHHGRKETPEKLQSMQAIRATRDFYSGDTVIVLTDLAFAPIYLLIIFYIGGTIVLAPMIIFVAIFIGGVALSMQLRDSLRSRRNTDHMRYNMLVSTLSNIGCINSFSLESITARRFEPVALETSRANHASMQASARIVNFTAVMSAAMTFATVAYGGIISVSGGLSIGALIACVLLCGRLLSPLQRAIRMWINYQELDSVSEKFLSLFDAPRIVTGDGVLPAQQRRNEPPLRISKLTIQRRRDREALFRDATATIARGEVCLIDGLTRREGTLLMKIIAGRDTNFQGGIFLNGADLNTAPLEQRASLVGYLTPDASLFRGTILDNLTAFGARDLDTALASARLFDIHKEAARLPTGWRTHVSGRSSAEISLGLSQRILMARAIAAAPGLILIDRVEQFLDAHSYDLLLCAVAKFRSHAAFIINTDDKNLARLATHKLLREEDGALTLKPAHNMMVRAA